MTMESGISNMWNPVTHTLGHFLRVVLAPKCPTEIVGCNSSQEEWMVECGKMEVAACERL